MESDSYATAATSWGIFAALVAGGCYYYLPRPQQKPEALRGKRRSEPDISQLQGIKEKIQTSKPRANAAPSRANGIATKRQTVAKGQDQPQPASAVVDAEEHREADDISNRQFAERMAKAQKGASIGSKEKQEKRVRTVKQSNAHDTPLMSPDSSQAGVDANGDVSPVLSPSRDAGGVSDMLEPVAPGPSTMRITAPVKPQKNHVARQAKEEVAETKKQRQNRKKTEERKIQREAEERERRSLEEKQRRTAREGRGEPAKNGMQNANVPNSSVWHSSTATDAISSAPEVRGTQHVPLLDTFDAESVSSSNGGLEPSTAATSTTSVAPAMGEHDVFVGNGQMAGTDQAIEDDSAWTTVGDSKKQKKKTTTDDTAALATPVMSSRPNGVTNKPSVVPNGKPKGFQALKVEYEQRADVADPDDASNWDA